MLVYVRFQGCRAPAEFQHAFVRMVMVMLVLVVVLAHEGVIVLVVALAHMLAFMFVVVAPQVQSGPCSSCVFAMLVS